METWTTIRGPRHHVGTNIVGKKTANVLNINSAAIIQIYGAGTASDQTSGQDVILKGKSELQKKARFTH